jgi:predicted metal-dependent hydrolase
MFNMNYVQYGNRRIDFEVKRGPRKKTIAIEVNSAAGVTVLAPEDLNEEKILEFVGRKAGWIIARQEKLEIKAPDLAKEFVSGEAFPYLGREYRSKIIRSTSGNGGKCEFNKGRLLVEINGGLDGEKRKMAVKEALLSWYLRQAEEKIKGRIHYYSGQLGKRPQFIKIKSQKKRWGSCSSTGVVRFNWKIIMAPLSVLDYVIVHELCHLLYPHHSPHFWQKVQSIIPDFKRRRKLLKQFSSAMEAYSL